MSVLRFDAGGGRPPASHEVLIVEPDGEAKYLTGLPWPTQPPFDEIGAYRGRLDAALTGRLEAAARAVIEGPPGPPGPVDAGYESVRADGREAEWSPEARPPAASRLVDEARTAIALVRASPWAVVHGEISTGEPLVRLVNPGREPLAVEGGELRAGWGRRTRPASPLRLAERPPGALELPAALDPGESVLAQLGPAGEPEIDEYDTVYALVHLRWRPPVASEGEWLDGWLVAGPAAA